MFIGSRFLSGAILVCGVCVAAQAQIDPAANEILNSQALKGSQELRATKSIWRIHDRNGVLIVYTIGDYELRLAAIGDGTSAVGVYKNGTVITSSQAVSSSVPRVIVEPTSGFDVDKDGGIDAVVESYSGGMHCCYGYQVLSFAEPFRIGATLETGGATLELVNGSAPNVVFQTLDGVLEYWHSDFASSLFPSVHVQFDRDKVALAEAWMKYPAPTDEEWAKMKADAAAAFASKEDWIKNPENGEPPFAPRALLDQVVTLIYHGNGAHGLRLLQETWKGDAARPGAIAADLLTQLANSQYWDGIKTLTGWTGEPAAIAQAGIAAK
jgi:hypothetical protein